MAYETELFEVLSMAHQKTTSAGCPYLALAEEMGYISIWGATHLPDVGLSNFGRLSTHKIMQTGGFPTEYAQFIYEKLEEGFELDSIATSILCGEAREWNYDREERDEDYED